MNKAYKVVFNKLRGTMMVVNEATSSVQKKGAKTVMVAAAMAGVLLGGTALANTEPSELTTNANVDAAYTESYYLAGDTELINGRTGNDAEILKGAVVDTKGHDLTLKDNGQGGSYSGLIGHGTVLTGGGTLTIVGTASAENGLGYGGSTITVDVVDINIDNAGDAGASAVYADETNGGSHIVTANTVKLINKKQTAVSLQESTVNDQKIEVKGFTQLDIEGGWDGHGVRLMHNANGSIILTGKEGTESTVNISSAKQSTEQTGRSAIYLGSSADNNSSVEITATNVNIESRTTEKESENGFKYGAVIAMTKNAHQLTINADNLKVSNLNGDANKETYAIGVAHGTANLTGKQSVQVDGQVLVENASKLTMTGKTITVNSEFGRGIQSYSKANVVVGNDKTENVTISSKDLALFAREGNISVVADKFTASVTGKGDYWVIGAQNNTQFETAPDNRATLSINANDISLIAPASDTEDPNIGIAAYSNSKVDIEGNLFVKADHAIDARGYSTLNVNVNGDHSTRMEGDIVFETPNIPTDPKNSGDKIDAYVTVNLTGADSYWTGSAYQYYGVDKYGGTTSTATSDYTYQKFVRLSGAPTKYGDVNHFAVTLSQGGAWNITDNSFVNILKMDNGGKIQSTAGSSVSELNIGTLDVQGSGNSIFVPNAKITFKNGMTVDDGGDLTLDANTIVGSVNVKGGSSLVVDSIRNEGAISVIGSNLTIGTRITNEGTITLASDSTVTALLKGADLSSGTVTLIDGNGKLDNQSELTKNGIYDISWKLDDNGNKTGDINVKTKSAEQIVSDINVSEQQADTVAAILPTIIGSGSAQASSPIAQIASALGTALELQDSQTVAQIAEDLAPSTAPVVSSVSQGVNNAIAGVANARMAANRAAGDVFTGGSAWAQVIYNSADQDATKRTAKLESDTYGVTVGVDGKIGDNLTIGAGFGVTKTDAESGTRDIDVDSYALFGYTEYNADNGWFVNGMVNAIRGRYEENKMPAGVKLTAKYQTTVLGAGVATGYHFENGISPEVGLRYLRTHQGSYNDGAQKIHTDGTNLLTASIGAKYEKTFEQGDWVLKPSARVAATYDVVSDDTESAIRVIGGGQYHVISAHQKRAAYEAGLGLEASNGDWDFSVSYNGEFRSHFQSHTGMIKAKYNF